MIINGIHYGIRTYRARGQGMAAGRQGRGTTYYYDTGRRLRGFTTYTTST